MSKKNSIYDEDNFEEVMFTFLKHVDLEKKERDKRIKDRFLEYLKGIGNERTETLLNLFVMDIPAFQKHTSPAIRTVIEKALYASGKSLKDLKNIIGMEEKDIAFMLNEGVRVTENNIKELVETLSYRFNIKQQLKLRDILLKGIKYISLNENNSNLFKIAARKK